jgi:hypothetical protein
MRRPGGGRDVARFVFPRFVMPRVADGWRQRRELHEPMSLVPMGLRRICDGRNCGMDPLILSASPDLSESPLSSSRSADHVDEPE